MAKNQREMTECSHLKCVGKQERHCVHQSESLNEPQDLPNINEGSHHLCLLDTSKNAAKGEIGLKVKKYSQFP